MYYDTKDTWLSEVKPRLYFVILFIIHLGYLKPMSRKANVSHLPFENRNKANSYLSPAENCLLSK